MINEQVGELHHITSEWSIDIQIGKSQWRKIHYDVAFELFFEITLRSLLNEQATIKQAGWNIFEK